jgi:hypothetical protein
MPLRDTTAMSSVCMVSPSIVRLNISNATGTDLVWDDLELLHHFSTSTFSTLARKVEHYPMWQVSIPRMSIFILIVHVFRKRKLQTCVQSDKSTTRVPIPETSFGSQDACCMKLLTLK